MRLKRGQAFAQNPANVMLSMHGTKREKNETLSSPETGKTLKGREGLRDTVIVNANKKSAEVTPTRNLRSGLRKRNAQKYVEGFDSDGNVVEEEAVGNLLELGRSEGQSGVPVALVGGGGRGISGGKRGLKNHSEFEEPSKEVPDGAPDCLAGLTFVIGGKLDRLERKEAEDLIKQHGGQVAESISKEVDYLLVDKDNGIWKFSEDMGINFLTVDGLFDMIRKYEPTKASSQRGPRMDAVDNVVASVPKGTPSEVQALGPCFTPTSTTKKREMIAAQKEIGQSDTRLTFEVDEPTSEGVSNLTEKIIRDGVRNQDMDMLDISAIVQDLQNSIGIEEDTSQDSDQPAQLSQSSGQRKRKRGKTVLKETSTRVLIEFNQRGQPIRSNSAAYSTYLGLIGREVVPITISDWREVPLNLKERLWIMVKQKFVVPEHVKKMTLKLIGKNWREYKARLRTTFYDIYENDDERILNCPDDVELEDWKIFVANISNPDYMEKRTKMKEVRKHHKFPQTSSRKGYARLEDEMKSNIDDPSSITRAAVWTKGHTKKSGEPVNDLAKEKIEEINKGGSSGPDGRHDTLPQVLGPDIRGRARVGFGTEPIILSDTELSTLRVHALEEEVKELRKEVSSMEAMRKEISALKNLFAKFLKSQQEQRSSQHIKCKLFRLIPEDVVAHGFWYSDDPTAVVQHEPIGPGMSKIFVTEAVQCDALLVKRTNELQTMGDAVAKYVVWPTSSLIKETDA